MDYTSIATSVATVVLSIGAVSTFLGKVLPHTVKYVILSKDAITALDDVLESLQDGKLTPEEITQLQIDIAKFKADLLK